MFGLGKTRSKYGEFLDRNGIKQEDISTVTGLNRDTVSEVCSKPEYTPRRSTMVLLVSALRHLTKNNNVDQKDFWEC